MKKEKGNRYFWKILNADKNLDPLDVLLKNRGIISDSEKEEYLNGKSLEHYIKKFDKEFLQSLKLAKKIIEDSISKNNPIVIHGDYDADGVFATAILYESIREKYGYEFLYAFIPNRFDHGYGLSIESIESSIEVINKSTNDAKNEILFITVDSGITSVDAVNYAKKLGHKVIITDHHQKPNELPTADCIVWNDKVVGSTISLLLSVVLGVSKDDHFSYAGIATVTDVQPLTGFNRYLVKKSLSNINSKLPNSLDYLLSTAGRKPGKLSSYDFGWIIGPRINATGRLEDALTSFKLLTEKDINKIESYARELNFVNQKRQELTRKMFDLVKIDRKNLPKIIITESTEFHEGIIGLVASNIVKEFYRPSIVISIDGGMGKGSVRSIKGINIIEILREFSGLFENLGGHPMAAGFSIKEENILELKKVLYKYFEDNVKDDVYVKELCIDTVLDISQIDDSLYNKISMLEPFGVDNNEPLFVSYGLKVANVKIIGNNEQHLILNLLDPKSKVTVKSLLFYYKNSLKSLDVEQIDLVYKIKKNEFNGYKNYELIIEDLRC